jgi:peptidoglycan/xylan/chitin deacetylase (PgdA/CDA1 family)
VPSYVTEGRALRRARPFASRVRAAARGSVIGALSMLPRRASEGVRIVHYHYVFDDERESFARQLAFLASSFEPVSLSEAVERLRTGHVRGRELVVTFDDGFKNLLTNAAPALAEHGIRACVYLVTELVGSDGEDPWQRRLHLPRPIEPLTWDDATRLLALGHEIGSHTRTHADLVSLTGDELDAELRGSREELVHHFGPIAHLSVPYGDAGRFSRSISAAAREVGYGSCATAIRGRNRGAEDVWALRRDHLDASWPARDLRWFLA